MRRAWPTSMSSAASVFDHLLGRSCQLELRRVTPSGAFLAEPESEPDAPSLLLLGPEIPKDAKPGDLLDVFVYLDSEDRPLATTVVIHPLPAVLVKKLGPAPEGHRYAVVDGDVLLLVTATRVVMDAVANALD